MIFLKIIGYLATIYFVCALALFIILILGNYDVKFTNHKTNEVTYLSGVKKIIAYFCMSFLWIVAINKGE